MREEVVLGRDRPAVDVHVAGVGGDAVGDRAHDRLVLDVARQPAGRLDQPPVGQALQRAHERRSPKANPRPSGYAKESRGSPSSVAFIVIYDDSLARNRRSKWQLSGALACVMLCLTASPPLTVLSVMTYRIPGSGSKRTPSKGTFSDAADRRGQFHQWT